MAETHYHILRGVGQILVVRHIHVWHPPTDVLEEEDRLVIIVEIAGMKEGDFKVYVTGQRLIISGTRSTPSMTPAAYHQLEVRYGEFQVEVALPWKVDDTAIAARYDDGFLRVDLPKQEQQTVRRVEVEMGTPENLNRSD